MAPMPASAPAPALAVALGVGALLGGLAGGFLAGRMGASGAAAPALAAGPLSAAAAPPPERDEAGIEHLLGTLIEEVRALRTSLASGRQSAPTGAPMAPMSSGGAAELVAALEDLTAALRQASSGSAGAQPLRSGLPTIDFPQGAARADRLLELHKVEDEQQRVRPFLLWNYQQVLDHFGPPTAIWPGEKWMYEIPSTGEQVELHFQYGLLTNIY